MDTLSPRERSERMSRVRRQGNISTERKVESALVMAGIGGWEKHPKDIPGKPDFFFREYSLAVFVDGCFWHCCPKCKRRMPASHHKFWSEKLDENRRRDNRIRRRLNRRGYHVMRIWEHDLKQSKWLKRLEQIRWRISNNSSECRDYYDWADETAEAA